MKKQEFLQTQEKRIETTAKQYSSTTGNSSAVHLELRQTRTSLIQTIVLNQPKFT